MIDELKQWEYDKGYERGKADMLKDIEDILDNRISSLENVDMRIAMRSVKSIIHDLSSVNSQEPKTGHWINDKCSICGKGIEDLIDSREWYKNETPNYCPFCGKRVVESEVK